ncbi:TPA: hypothetical protein ACPT1K_005333, partial [Klebsiella variicola]
ALCSSPVALRLPGLPVSWHGAASIVGRVSVAPPDNITIQRGSPDKALCAAIREIGAVIS